MMRNQRIERLEENPERRRQRMAWDIGELQKRKNEEATLLRFVAIMPSCH
jgi:hypothetical protein